MVSVPESASGKRLLYIANIRLPTEKAHGAQIMKMCEAFTESGIEVELIVPRRKNSIAEDPHSYYGIQVPFKISQLPVIDTVSWGFWGFVLESISFAFSAVRYAKRGRYDTHYGRDEFILSIFRLCGINTLVWETHTGSWNIPAQIVARSAKRIIGISNGLKAFYVERGVPTSRIYVAHDGVSLENFESVESLVDARRRLRIPQDARVVLYIGKLDGWKGTSTLFAAATLLPDDVITVVIGGEEEQLKKLVPQYPRVLFLGPRPYRELAANLVAGDVLVIPNTGHDPISKYFTSPLKLFAYMAARKPIVASDLPSIREVLDDHDAFFVLPDDPSSLASGIVSAFAERSVADEKAGHAFKRVNEYTWRIRASRIVSFLYS